MRLPFQDNCARSAPALPAIALFAALVAPMFGCAERPRSAAAEQHVDALSVDPPVVISQVYGGGGNSGAQYTHDFVELFNRSSSPVTLSGKSIQYTSASATSANFGSSASLLSTFPAGAIINPGQYYLVQLAQGAGGSSPLPSPFHTGTAIAMSGTSGKVALVSDELSLGCNGGSNPCSASQVARVIDLVGYGTANYAEGTPTSMLSNTTAALRAGNGCTDTNNNSTDFAITAPAPRTTATPAAPCDGDAAPFVASTTPLDGASGVAPSANITIAFGEPVAATGAWFAFACNLSGPIAATVSGGPSTFTLTPPANLSDGDSCQITVVAANVTDLDAADPPDGMAGDYTFDFTVAAPVAAIPIHTVQGAGHLSGYAGITLGVGPAIVTALRSNGFFMQDPVPDASEATSEGIFVFTASAPSVAVGQSVIVTGNIAEYRAGCTPSCAASSSAYDNLTVTEIDGPSISVLTSGNPLPPPVVLGSAPGERAAPLQVIEDDATGNVETSGSFDPANDGLDFYESLEGMRVQINSPAVIDPTRVFSSSNSLEIGVLARPDAGLRTPRGGIVLSAADYNPERVFLTNILNASLPSSYPTVNVGDSFAGAVIGVFDYGFANYKLLTTQALPAVTSGGLAQESTALTAGAASQLTIASLNVENLDPLDPASKLQELASIVVSHLGSPDLIALEEVQDNNGATNNGVVDANVTLTGLASAITSAGGPSYVYRQINPVDGQDGGEPGGNIRVAFLYRTDRGLSFVDRGSATSTTANSVVASAGAPQLGYSPGRIDPTSPAFASSRKPLAAELTFYGKRLFVIANHFNSKGGDDPLFGRFQPPVLSSESQRVQQASIVAGFVDDVLDIDANAYVIVLGDLNDFSSSPPVEILKATGLTPLADTLPQNERYSYVYQGNSQELDHIMVSPSLLARATFDIVHVNAEFSVQSSDHDPGIVQLQLGEPPVFAMSNNPPTLVVNGALAFQVIVTGDPQPTFALISGPAGMTVNALSGVVSWTANVAPGNYAFTVQAGNGVATVTKQFAVTVTNPAPVPALPSLALPLFALLMMGTAYRAMRKKITGLKNGGSQW